MFNWFNTKKKKRKKQKKSYNDFCQYYNLHIGLATNKEIKGNRKIIEPKDPAYSRVVIPTGGLYWDFATSKHPYVSNRVPIMFPKFSGYGNVSITHVVVYDDTPQHHALLIIKLEHSSCLSRGDSCTFNPGQLQIEA